MKKILRILIISFCSIFFLVGSLRLGLLFWARERTEKFDDIRPADVAIVPGAGINANKTPTLPLSDRIDGAIQLYNAGKVKKLLMTGDNTSLDYNEPGAMRDYAIAHGVPADDIVLDYAGRRTYDSCYRAKAIFGVDSAIIVTQSYHLPRALYLCNAMDIDIRGYEIEQSQYVRLRYLFWQFREVFATIMAFWDVNLRHPVPVLGPYEPIFPSSRP